MSIYYFITLLPAIIVTLWGYHHTRNNSRWAIVSSKEMLISLGLNFLSSVIMVVLLNVYVNGQVHDTYILNGKVISKYKQSVSCEHSYQICTTSGKTTTCVTYYEHFEDYDWRVKLSIGTLNIKRVDSQGNKEPPRFSNVVIGEPASLEFNYSNYLLADKNSLFLQNAKGASNVREPRVYDYYRVDLVNTKDEALNSILLEHLQGKVYNVKLVILDNKPIEEFYTLMKTWVGGKINDVIIVISRDGQGNVLWVKSNSYAKGLANQLTLKSIDAIPIIGEIYTRDVLIKQLQVIDKGYKLPSESDFEEKLSMVDIPSWLVILLTIVNLIISIVVHIKMKTEEL